MIRAHACPRRPPDFLSAVTAEFARYRIELAGRFERMSNKVVFQEEFEYHDTDLVESSTS